MSIKDFNNFSKYLESFILEKQLNLLNQKIFKTKIETVKLNSQLITYYVNEFWTSKQRQASSLHEISYRACFKPQLPRFFIKIMSKKNDIIYDPFGGRGTTAIEAALNERNIISNDINPLSKILIEPRFFVPNLKDIKERLNSIKIDYNLSSEIDLSMFYHKKTLAELVSLKNYLEEKRSTEKEDNIDKWIRMVATNRLTGHSPGFFSVYTLPPNQAVSQESQIKINKNRKQTPEYKNINERIYKKSKQLLKDITPEERNTLKKYGEKAILLSIDSRHTQKYINNDLIKLTVTSPPFLDIVQYSDDNWLRCWFNCLDDKKLLKEITMAKNIKDWSKIMQEVFNELYRITMPGGWVAFEVGEVRNGKIKLEDYVIPLGIKSGFEFFGVVINQQEFTKTSNIWGIINNKRGTNSNRIVVFKK